MLAEISVIVELLYSPDRRTPSRVTDSDPSVALHRLLDFTPLFNVSLDQNYAVLTCRLNLLCVACIFLSVGCDTPTRLRGRSLFNLCELLSRHPAELSLPGAQPLCIFLLQVGCTVDCF